MKKIIPALAIVGAIAAAVAYKVKKDEKKQIAALEEELKNDDIYEAEHVLAADYDYEEDHLESNVKKEPIVVEGAKEAPVVKEEAETSNIEYPHLNTNVTDEISQMTQDQMNKLAEDGDNHENERPIQHFVHFDNETNMDEFKQTVINQGFVVTKGEGDFDLVVLHISSIDRERIIASVLYLAEQALAHNGEYKGWTSKVSF